MTFTVLDRPRCENVSTEGILQIGSDADLTIVDPDAEWTLDCATLQSKTTATPFDRETFQGRVTYTI